MQFTCYDVFGFFGCSTPRVAIGLSTNQMYLALGPVAGSGVPVLRTTKAKPLTTYVERGCMGEPDDNLLSHWLQHYHWRRVVSRSCSGWEGVVPTRYGHQA